MRCPGSNAGDCRSTMGRRRRERGDAGRSRPILGATDCRGDGGGGAVATSQEEEARAIRHSASSDWGSRQRMRGERGEDTQSTLATPGGTWKMGGDVKADGGGDRDIGVEARLGLEVYLLHLVLGCRSVSSH